MCERRSRVLGSMVWYSSSIPMVNEGFMRRLRLGSHGSLRRGFGFGFRACLAGGTLGRSGAAQHRCPAELLCWILVAQCFLHRQLSDRVHDPLEILLTNRVHV